MRVMSYLVTDVSVSMHLGRTSRESNMGLPRPIVQKYVLAAYGVYV